MFCIHYELGKCLKLKTKCNGTNRDCDEYKEDDVFGFQTSFRDKDMERDHEIRNNKCEECESYYFGMGLGWNESYEVDFPVEHDNCGGFVHLNKEVFADGYSCDIRLYFWCNKCGKVLDTWTEGELVDPEFEKAFGFIPSKKTEST